jgi:hypothetical protein
MEFVYDAVLFLRILELLCGLLIIGTLVKKFKEFKKFTEGAILILVSGLIIVLKQLFDLSGLNTTLPDEFFNLFIYLFFAIGLLYFSKRLTMFEKTQERHLGKLEKKRELREKYTPKSIKKKQANQKT